jgi:coenzyme F420 hydrogenase subunit beta
MKEVSDIIAIDKAGLCLGCGLCESVCGKDNVEMKLLSDGFFHPVVKHVVKEKEEIISRICPGVNVINDIPFTKEESVWGHIDNLWSGYSTDDEIRTKGSSGGIVSAIAIYLLENGLVDGVMQVGGDTDDYQRNALKISRSRSDVLNCASSRYAPALIFDKIFEILDQDEKVYCFIGKPCDISALKNFLDEYPRYVNRITLTVSIMCAGLPSFNGTLSIINGFKAIEPVKNLVYRGNGWPGYFSFIDKTGSAFQKSYNDSWGKTLNKHLKFRCKVCPDGIGIQADIAVGDAWETNDGYPDFAEKDGQSLIISRTTKGSDLLKKAAAESKMLIEDLNISKIRLMQPYQYGRRTKVGARVLAFMLVKRKMLNYKNLHVFENFRLVKVKALISEFYGTFKRLLTKQV